MKSLFEHKFEDLSVEIFEKIIECGNFFVERIISNGQATAQGEWLSQERAELVFLLKGEAGLRFKSDDKTLIMKPGDYVLINSCQEHRVDFTSAVEETVWLAIHFEE